MRKIYLILIKNMLQNQTDRRCNETCSKQDLGEKDILLGRFALMNCWQMVNPQDSNEKIVKQTRNLNYVVPTVSAHVAPR